VLAQEDVARYLLARRLVGPEAVVDGDLAVSDVSSRNRTYRVHSRGGPGYVLKQGVTADAVATVANEANVYERLVRTQSGVIEHLPRFFGYDPAHGVLVLELVQQAEDLRTMQLRTGHFSAGPAALLGGALGALHRATETAESGPLTPGVPWVLWLHRPDARLFRDVSSAGLELIRIVQGAAGFSDGFERLRQTCRIGALVHGDVKWDNCLVTSSTNGREELKLIDWEVASAGDPCWDIGSALSHYLSAWLFSIPVTGAVPAERFPELAVFPLDSMKPALRACWLAYVEARALYGPSSMAVLLRAVQLMGARLVQTAFEAAQMVQQLTSPLILHLQLALNILLRPEEAATQLLGLPLAHPTIV
jgi:hypothetical protein